MSYTSGILICVSTIFTLVSSAAAQNAPRQLTARELFYSAAETPKAAAPAAPKLDVPKAAPKKGPVVAKRLPPAGQQQPVGPGTPSVKPAPESVHSPDGTAIVSAAAIGPAPEAAPMRAPAPASGPALGLRYSIQRREGDRMVDVPADTVFHSGDRIQFSVQTNLPGYLYIVSQGSSGTWKPMFPSAEIADGNNHVDGFRTYAMPPGTRIVFDEQKGMEKVFIVFSREPEADLENIIYSLQAPKRPAAAPAEAPEKSKTLVATNAIDDGTIGRLRKAYARDLIIERVDAANSGENKETAMYLVNPTGSSDSRVVADLSLVHK